MTPDSPKGPESEARPVEDAPSKELIAYLRRLLGQRFDELLATANFLDEDDQASTLAVFEDLLPFVAQEIVNRSAAYDLMLTEVRVQRDEWKQAAGAEADLLDQANAEVSRLREQLAAQQRVWAPEDPTDESARLANALRFVGVVDPDDDCMSVFETRGEGIKHWVPVDAIALRMLEHGWGVSSSEVEASRQHEVRMHPCADRFHAKCCTCDEFRCGNQKEAEDWKDQHEADTLVPQLQANSKLEQNLDEGRPSGSGAAAPQPRVWNAGDPEPRTHYLDPEACYLVVDAEGRLWQRREQNEGGYWDRLDTRFGKVGVADWGYLTRERGPLTEFLTGRLEDAAQAARSEETPEDPSLQSPGFKVGDEVRWCWSGDNADGTWFKARLTEEHPANYPKGWAGEITDCGTAYTAEHMGEVPLGFHVYMDIPSMTVVPVPSPSLRKEGEDTHG